MIFITGDCHGEWGRFSTKNFPEQKAMTRDDYVIVCGDFGIWHDTESENWWLNWLEDKPFTLCFVDGNHENFDRLYSGEFDTVDFHGGKAHRIRENVFHLMRGYVFNICGNKIFAFGGASSHDIDDGILDRNDFVSDEDFNKTVHAWRRSGKSFRINHISWWEQEVPSKDEMKFGCRNLEENNNEVDFIVSHCCPQEISSLFSHGSYKPNLLTAYFNKIAQTVSFSKWFFGHYHDDIQVTSEFIMLYTQIVRVA